MENTVIGVYDSYAQAESAMNELLATGFARGQLRLSSSDSSEHGVGQEGEQHAGSGVGHFFRNLFGLDEYREHHGIYAEALRRGGCLLSADADNDQMRELAVQVMNRHDPVDMDERAAHWRSQGWTGYDENAPRMSEAEIARERSLYTQGRDMSLSESAGMSISPDQKPSQAPEVRSAQAASSETARIPVVEEELRVGKRLVQSGGVRVYQHVTEKPVHESVQLREEHVHVERHALDQPASEADLAAFKEGTIEMREMAEEPVVSKTAHVVGEVLINKETSEHTEDINDTLRSTDVEVERLGDDADFRRHWQSTYGAAGARYEDYDAAYRYGSSIVGTEGFKNYRWQDAEPALRSDWEAHHPESAWDKVKDAVRYAAEKVTGQRQ